MGESGDGGGVVIAIRPRHRAQARCSCGWVGKSRWLLSSAKMDALIHASRHDCRPAIPLVQPETISALKPPGVLTVRCPAGCGEAFPVPMTITDVLSIGTAHGEPSTQFAADAPQLHDCVYQHLRTCPSARSWVDTVLHGATAPTGMPS